MTTVGRPTREEETGKVFSLSLFPPSSPKIQAFSEDVKSGREFCSVGFSLPPPPATTYVEQQGDVDSASARAGDAIEQKKGRTDLSGQMTSALIPPSLDEEKGRRGIPSFFPPFARTHSRVKWGEGTGKEWGEGEMGRWKETFIRLRGKRVGGREGRRDLEETICMQRTDKLLAVCSSGGGGGGKGTFYSAQLSEIAGEEERIGSEKKTPFIVPAK